MSWRERPAVLVAEREYTEAFRAKSTRIMLALSAAAIVALIVITHVVSGDDERSTTDLAIVGQPTASEAATYDAIGDALDTDIVVAPVDNDESAKGLVSDGDADLAILGDGTMLTDEPLELDDGSTLATIVNVLRSDLALTNGLAEAGLSDEEIDAAKSVDPPELASINAESDDDDSSRLGAAVVMNVMLFIMLQIYGTWIIQGVTREKASRVVEVLLSTLRPRQLMFGKIAGVGLVALTHALILIAVALITSKAVGLEVLDGFRIGDIAIGGVWFLLGYGLYCSAFAAAGALCNRVEDAQGAAMPITLPLLAAYIVGFSAAGGANTLLWVLAFFPPTAVLSMPALYATGEAPVWAMLLSMAVTIVAIVVAARFAAAIYERSILRSGKRVRWRQALKRTAA